MTFTPLFATRAQILLFNSHIKPGDSFGLATTSTEWSALVDILHESAEAQIMTFLNRTDMIAADLTANVPMAAILRKATISMVTNAFTQSLQAKTGSVISLGDMLVKIVDYVVMTKEIKEMLIPHVDWTGSFGTVDPDTDYTV